MLPHLSKAQVKEHLEPQCPLCSSGGGHWPLHSEPGGICPCLSCILSAMSWILKLHDIPFWPFVCFHLDTNFSFSRLKKGRARGGMKFSNGREQHQGTAPSHLSWQGIRGAAGYVICPQAGRPCCFAVIHFSKILNTHTHIQRERHIHMCTYGDTYAHTLAQQRTTPVSVGVDSRSNRTRHKQMKNKRCKLHGQNK